MHLTQSSHAALAKAAETWNRERAGQAPDGVVLHQISATDTLQGLAIQYGATQQVRGVWVWKRGLAFTSSACGRRFSGTPHAYFAALSQPASASS